jgi:hypothetical protein
VPLLKAKPGEFAALREVPRALRSSFSPLVELLPVPSKAESVVRHVVKQADSILHSWASGGRLFLDGGRFPRGATMDNGKHPLMWIATRVQDSGIEIVPVLGGLSDPQSETAVGTVIAAYKSGVCIRLRDHDLRAEPDQLQANLEAVLSRLNLNPAEVDIIIDQGEIVPGTEGRVSRAAVALLMEFPYTVEWRTLTLCGTAFPNALGELGKEDAAELPRAEWDVWTNVQRRRQLPRIPTYGDYATSPVDFPPEIDGPMTVPVSIRYTTADYYLIRKDGAWTSEGGEAAERLAQWLVARQEYSGPDFSWGDKQIDLIARGAKRAKARNQRSTGGASEWRGYGASHHIAFVTEELRALSSANPAEF